MTPESAILLDPGSDPRRSRILQLYRHVELLGEGDPPRNSLFVLGPGSGPLLGGAAEEDQLLVVDPPLDVASRFRLEARVAALFTGEPLPIGIPLLQTMPGGTAHIRVGEQYLDIYTQQHGAVVHLPALGILCSGSFGSNLSVPLLGEGSDGEEELQTLRLLARLVKEHRLQLLIPRLGDYTTGKQGAMELLAGDVAYLHSLRRVVLPLVDQLDPLDKIMAMAETLVPASRRTDTAIATHRANIGRLYRRTPPRAR